MIARVTDLTAPLTKVVNQTRLLLLFERLFCIMETTNTVEIVYTVAIIWVRGKFSVSKCILQSVN